MTVALDEGGRRPAGPPSMSVAIANFMTGAAEYCDSAVVVAATHPTGRGSVARSEIKTSGNGYASEVAAAKWLAGELPDGAWFATNAGLVAVGSVDPDFEDPSAPLPWDDAVSRRLEAWADGLAMAADGLYSGLLVVATAGAGPFGSTKTVSRAYGNSFACAGVLDAWFERMDKDGL